MEVSVRFTRSSLTASMFDLSAKDKPRSPFGKLKDKMKGKKKYDLESASAIIPSSVGALDVEDDFDVGAKKSKIKGFLKSKLRKSSLTQSNTSLGSDSTISSASLGPAANEGIKSPSRHSSLSTERSGKRIRALRLPPSLFFPPFSLLLQTWSQIASLRSSVLHEPPKTFSVPTRMGESTQIFAFNAKPVCRQPCSGAALRCCVHATSPRATNPIGNRLQGLCGAVSPPCHPKTGRKHQLVAVTLEEGSSKVLPNEGLAAGGRSSDRVPVIKAIPALGDLQTNKALVVN